ncbi:MAG: hypothetical protein BWY65_00991 [Firmicutes bacterium ADurb.Bin373]|nr:MAG: hypothetical protein BWY65_00991 [Firmicutes bacterium ADurb.Bin373]
MTGRIGILGAECGAEGIDFVKRHAVCFRFQLAADRQVCFFAEEIFGEVNDAFFITHDSVKIQGGYPEHISCAFRVTAGDDGGVYVDKAVFLKKLMDGVGGDRPDSKNGGKCVCAGAQVGNRAQEFEGVPFFLQGVVRRGKPLDFYRLRL